MIIGEKTRNPEGHGVERSSAGYDDERIRSENRNAFFF